MVNACEWPFLNKNLMYVQKTQKSMRNQFWLKGVAGLKNAGPKEKHLIRKQSSNK